MKLPYLVRLLLLPLSLLYVAITSLRNWLFDRGVLSSTSFDLPVISVGNLTVGGTGKTPHVEYLIDLLGPNRKISTLSRGYGRKTKGYILATPQVDAETIGDEPFQYFLKYYPKTAVSVCEKRVVGVQQLIKDTDPDLILLDDAFQHRPIRPSLQILLTDYGRLFYRDFAFPAGLLRESRSGAQRADIVIISKCPPLSMEEKEKIKKKIRKYASAPIFFSSITYLPPRCFVGSQPISTKRIGLLSGIAQPQLFEKGVESSFEILKHFVFGDHHHYVMDELLPIIDWSNAHQAPILCTEKDFVKLKSLLTEQQQAHFFYVPIKVVFDEPKAFERRILDHIESF